MKGLTVGMVAIAALLGGCNASARRLNLEELRRVRKDSVRRLHQAVSDHANPAIRSGAVEGLELGIGAEALPWIRLALLDEQPVVLFAGCVAVGRLRDEGSLSVLRKLALDADANVRVGALFALHQLGDTSGSGWLPGLLLTHEDISVRRNAALVLGWMGQQGGVKLLARAMHDPETSVRRHALAALALLGNEDAVRDLLIMSQSGVGSEEVFAINALAEIRSSDHRDNFRYKLQTATHLESRLAAAYALGLLGLDDGYRLALRSLRIELPRVPDDAGDPPEDQVLRAKLLAIRALGSIGKVESVSVLNDLMRSHEDDRVRTAYAAAILRITRVRGHAVSVPRRLSAAAPRAVNP